MCSSIKFAVAINKKNMLMGILMIIFGIGFVSFMIYLAFNY